MTAKTKKLSFISPLLFFLLLSFTLSNNFYSNDPEITSEELFEHVKILASDEFAGRFPGSAGMKLAEEYAVNEFKSYGLQPGAENGFIQNFEMITRVELGGENKFKITSSGESFDLKIGEDYIPMGFSADKEINAPLVFVGYGISAPDLNYDDYKDVDLSGKIAVIMRYSPTSKDPHDNKFQRYEYTRYKTSLAKEKDPAGIIYITGPLSNDEDVLMKMRYDNAAKDAGIPAVHMKREVLEKILSANGVSLKEIQSQIDSLQRPNSFEIKNATANIKTTVIPQSVTTGNVIAYLEGSDPVKKNEVIVIGAHYDHLGYGEDYGSLYSGSDRKIHYGADDNASGTAGVFELAEKLAANKNNLDRSYLFMLYSGEEAGLLGSNYFVNSELFKNYNIVSMLNMDMIGRMDNNKLIVYGTGSSPYWENKIKELDKNYNFDITYTAGGFGRSDHASFYRKDIPALHFFTGTHLDYHSPSDTYNKINSKDQEKVVKMIYDLAVNLDKLNTKPEFTKVVEQTPQTTSMSNVTIYVGTIPDYSYQGEGMKLSGVKEGSPADKGGLKGEDIIIKFGETDVKNIYDYMFAMGKYKSGDEVDITVKRNDQDVVLKVVLGSR